MFTMNDIDVILKYTNALILFNIKLQATFMNHLRNEFDFFKVSEAHFARDPHYS